MTWAVGGSRYLCIWKQTWRSQVTFATSRFFIPHTLPQGLGLTFQKSESIADIQKLKQGLGIKQFCSLFLREEKNHGACQENNFGNSINCEGEAEPACG